MDLYHLVTGGAWGLMYYLTPITIIYHGILYGGRVVSEVTH